MANLARTYQRFGKNFEQDDKRRMSLIVGFYENAIFCEINEFLEKSIKGLAKFMRRQKRTSCTKRVINKKMANIGNKGKFRR